ncbi:MAG TPA: IPT/TIG domain-containing protein, partial [Candidatus Binataceae bacterium]|nr:IPT/TIG domain-containing protein [Candidatus Binataceae bacterium]
MRKLIAFTLLLLAFALILATVSYAQTITVTPTEPSVVVGATVQFAAQASGLPSNQVSWSVAGQGAGNATVGTITSAGAYTAPATTPGQNPVQIVATSVADTSITGIAYAYILNQGPTITSIAPNPLTIGTFTVTIQGSGFQSGATVFDTYGGGEPIQLVTTSVTSGAISATGYQGPAASASFCVKNPGSSCGNALAVPIGSPIAAATSTTTITATPRPSATPTAIKTATATARKTPTPTATKKPKPTRTPTPTKTPRKTPTPTRTEPSRPIPTSTPV